MARQWVCVQDTARISTIIERQHKKEAERKASGRDVDSLVKGDYVNYNASSSKFKAAAKLIQVRIVSPPRVCSVDRASPPDYDSVAFIYLSPPRLVGQLSSAGERAPRNDGLLCLLERRKGSGSTTETPYHFVRQKCGVHPRADLSVAVVAA